MVLTKLLFGFLKFWVFYFSQFLFSFSLTWSPMAAKTSKRYSSLKSLLNPFKLFLNVLLGGPHKSTVLDFWNYEFIFEFIICFRKCKVQYCTLWIKWKVRERHIVTIYIIGKPYIYIQSDDTITYDLECNWRSQSRSIRFRRLISCKGAALGHMLLLNINRKTYMGSTLMQLHVTLVNFKSLCQGHSGF